MTSLVPQAASAKPKAASCKLQVKARSVMADLAWASFVNLLRCKRQAASGKRQAASSNGTVCLYLPLEASSLPLNTGKHQA
ncbi:hypothetical protein [Pseudomonas sp. S32]|uniref:hypothetical protein n=1 Tax=Pseudomonas sp. S32 TaxID=2767448 RepID=UPI001913D284|nr:hypothetical protein [Pseudomonas sp. S32]